MGNYTVYIHRNKINNKCYVGITGQATIKRWGRNGGGYLSTHSNGSLAHPKFGKAIKKYGWENFEHIIWANGLSRDDACRAERMLIAIWNTIENGYNMASGGETGWLGLHHTSSTKDKISKTKKENYVKERHPNYNKHHSEETKMKNARSHTCLSVVCLETGVIYMSTREAERKTGANHSSIKRCCEGKRYTANGKHWEYAFIKTE